LKIIISTLFIITLILFAFSRHYTSFLREHRSLRYYTNPTYYLYSIGEYIAGRFSSDENRITPIGNDAKIPVTDMDRELIILVIGEAARADRFSLNGYQRETNPLLKKEDIISFPNMYSCGTSTSVSVPCMFSIFDRKKYRKNKAKHTENILDVLSHAGVNILWRDNNSDSKGVALRVAYEDFSNPNNNPICDIECRDEGMLEGLQEYIDSQKQGDILIILHQMGNHGPAYYKRYPKQFEKFTPTCKTNQLEECTKEEINNAYDNAILYTDYFLLKIIKLLKQNANHFEAAMFYLGDHGESLGEKNIYLHGLPYFMAPEAQKHIAAMMWFGDGFKIDKNTIKKNVSKKIFSR
jgi:lipid A ethanolaminephosphotransferase